MKNIRDCKIGDHLLLSRQQPWTHKDTGTRYMQDITWVVEITELVENRVGYKTVEVLKAVDVCPSYGDPSEMDGGCALSLFENPIRYFSIKVL